MSKKIIRLTLIVTAEYDPNPRYYPEGVTIEEMAKIDYDIYREDPILFLENEDPKKIDMKYEII